MERRITYSFDYKKYSDELKKSYPIIGVFNMKVDYDCFTINNLDILMNVLKKIILNPIIQEKEITNDENEEDITCLAKQAKEIFNKLFANKNLVIYGHGGAGKKIIESDGMRCQYADLGSHFIGLTKTNDSLKVLNNWPHHNASQIAIMALNKTECNPIYIQREAKNSYDTEVNLIPNEYFAGYYDAITGTFVANPNFKIEHEYDERATGYVFDERFSQSNLSCNDSNICDLYDVLERINQVMYMASNMCYLSQKGYIDVLKQISVLIKKAYSIQKILNPEYIEKLKKEEELEMQKKLKEQENSTNVFPVIQDNWLDEWDDSKKDSNDLKNSYKSK